MSWHYLPVYVQHEKHRSYSLCEVYLDAHGKLDSWTEAMAVAPVGNDIPDLVGALNLMLQAAQKYEPVEYGTLKSGMTFQCREVQQ